MTRSIAPLCPRCGEHAHATKTHWGMRHDHCGLWSWGGKSLADSATHAARQAAHAAFDPLWQGGRYTRTGAYSALAARLGLRFSQCHMSLMDEATARRVPAIVQAMKEQHRGTDTDAPQQPREARDEGAEGHGRPAAGAADQARQIRAGEGRGLS